MSNDTVVLQDARLDPDRFILEDIDTSKGPTFNVSSLGKFFFNRTSHWVRWLELRDQNVLNGAPDCDHGEIVKDEDGVSSRVSWVDDKGVCTKCGGFKVGIAKTDSNYRIYTLSEVERMIHALAQNDAINGAQAVNASTLVYTLAKIHGYIS